MSARHPALAVPLLGLLLLVAGGLVRAAESDPGRTLGELYEVALLMDATVLDLNMLLGEEQNPVYKSRLDSTLKRLATAQQSSAASLAASGSDAAAARQVADNVAAFIKLARTNGETTMRTGAPEGAVIDEMMLRRKEARAALDGLYAGLEKQAKVSGTPLSEARALALILQQMSALYVETASAAGGVSYRTQDDSEATIDELARTFGARLGKMLARAQGDEAGKRVRSIDAKWRFIEKSMLNYRDKTVPFLVDRYTQTIVGDLVALADLLQGQR